MEKRLLEQIDACRRGMEDVRALGRSEGDQSDPRLRDLSEAVARGDERALRMLARVEAADAAIAAALRDVSVPDDLADRLLVALKAAEHGEPVDAAALRRPGSGDAPVRVDTINATITNVTIANSTLIGATINQQPAAPGPIQPAVRAGRTTRRSWLGWSAAAATVAAAVALFCALYPWSPPWVTSEEVAQDINVMYDSEIAHIDAEAWTPGAQVSGLPILSEALQPIQFREFKLGRHTATAYDLPTPGGAKRATLLVIHRRVRGLDYSLPLVPQLSTHGRHIGIWQSEDQVFALIVEGTARDYEQLIQPHATFI